MEAGAVQLSVTFLCMGIAILFMLGTLVVSVGLDALLFFLLVLAVILVVASGAFLIVLLVYSLHVLGDTRSVVYLSRNGTATVKIRRRRGAWHVQDHMAAPVAYGPRQAAARAARGSTAGPGRRHRDTNHLRRGSRDGEPVPAGASRVRRWRTVLAGSSLHARAGGAASLSATARLMGDTGSRRSCLQRKVGIAARDEGPRPLRGVLTSVMA
jgi:hypothetical protein